MMQKEYLILPTLEEIFSFFETRETDYRAMLSISVMKWSIFHKYKQKERIGRFNAAPLSQLKQYFSTNIYDRPKFEWLIPLKVLQDNITKIFPHSIFFPFVDGIFDGKEPDE
jgi:hypothetical protein